MALAMVSCKRHSHAQVRFSVNKVKPLLIVTTKLLVMMSKGARGWQVHDYDDGAGDEDGDEDDGDGAALDCDDNATGGDEPSD